jgi:hypothetical protein
MRTNKPGAELKPMMIVANDPEDLKGTLKRIGGSQSDNWNNILANQAVQALWLQHSVKDKRDRQYSATVAALIGIKPTDEVEGMIAAQLVAAHNAAIECYRRAMDSESSKAGARTSAKPTSSPAPMRTKFAMSEDHIQEHEPCVLLCRQKPTSRNLASPQAGWVTSKSRSVRSPVARA